MSGTESLNCVLSDLADDVLLENCDGVLQKLAQLPKHEPVVVAAQLLCKWRSGAEIDLDMLLPLVSYKSTVENPKMPMPIHDLVRYQCARALAWHAVKAKEPPPTIYRWANLAEQLCRRHGMAREADNMHQFARPSAQAATTLRDSGNFPGALHKAVQQLAHASEPKDFVLAGEILMYMGRLDDACHAARAAAVLLRESTPTSDSAAVADLIALIVRQAGLAADLPQGWLQDMQDSGYIPDKLMLNTCESLQPNDDRRKALAASVVRSLESKPGHLGRVALLALANLVLGDVNAAKAVLRKELGAYETISSSPSAQIPSMFLAYADAREHLVDKLLETAPGDPKLASLALAVLEMSIARPMHEFLEMSLPLSYAQCSSDLTSVASRCGCLFVALDVREERPVSAWLLGPGEKFDFFTFGFKDGFSLPGARTRLLSAISWADTAKAEPDLLAADLANFKNAVSVIGRNDEPPSARLVALVDAVLERVPYDASPPSPQLTFSPATGSWESASGFNVRCPAAMDDSNDSSSISSILRELYDNLWEPIETRWGDVLEQHKRFVVVATGAVTSLPLGFAIAPDGTLLGQRFTFSFAPSIVVYDRLRELAGSDQPSYLRAAIVADPSPMPNGLEQLSGARNEAEQQANKLEQRDGLLIGKEAQREKVLQGLRSANVAYFATHGLSSWNSSGLVVADDLLSPTTIAQDAFDARQQLPRGRRVAVLSCCSTAVGPLSRPDFLLDMASGMLSARFHSVLATVWPIKDDAVARALPKMTGPSLPDGPNIVHKIAYETNPSDESQLREALRGVGAFVAFGLLPDS